MIVLVPALAGALIVAGLLGLVVGLRPAAVPPRQSHAERVGVEDLTAAHPDACCSPVSALGLVGWLVTGWVLALVIAPGRCRRTADPARRSRRPPTRIARLEAMEEWTRSLSGVLTVGVGLEQALVATLRSTPAPIAPEVTRLVARLRARWDTEDGAPRLRRRTRRRHRRPRSQRT